VGQLAGAQDEPRVWQLSCQQLGHGIGTLGRAEARGGCWGGSIAKDMLMEGLETKAERGSDVQPPSLRLGGEAEKRQVVAFRRALRRT